MRVFSNNLKKKQVKLLEVEINCRDRVKCEHYAFRLQSMPPFY